MYTGKDVNLIDKKTQVVITSYEMSSNIIASDKHLNNDKTTRFGMVILGKVQKSSFCEVLIKGSSVSELQTQAILLLKSISERVGSDIQRNEFNS